MPPVRFPTRRATRVAAALLALLTAGAAVPGAAGAQVFLAAEPRPPFTIGPLFVRATVGPELAPVAVDLLWGLVWPPAGGGGGGDLYLLWPGAVTGDPALGKPDPELAHFVEGRRLAVIDEGRLSLVAIEIPPTGRDRRREPVPGGAPFVTYVRQGGPLGLTAPATYVRIPWTPALASRDWLVRLHFVADGLLTDKKASWIENAVQGHRHLFSIGFNDVRSGALFPLYFEHRDRVVRLADEPSQLLVNFSHADRLKIEEVTPVTSSRRLSESLENTEVVSHFLDPSEGITPQLLGVRFAYFSWLQSWAPVLIPTLFFVLGNLAAVVVRTAAGHLGRRLAGRVHFGRPGGAPGRRETGVILGRDTLARIAPGVTTDEEVLRLCGPDPEQVEKLAAPGGRTLVYRGRRVVPQRRRTFGWLTTVSRWDVEHHEVQIDVAGGLVTDVRAQVRRSRLDRVEPA